MLAYQSFTQKLICYRRESYTSIVLVLRYLGGAVFIRVSWSTESMGVKCGEYAFIVVLSTSTMIRVFGSVGWLLFKWSRGRKDEDIPKG